MIGTVILTALAVLFAAGFALVSVTRARHSARRVDSLREDEDRAARENAAATTDFGNVVGYGTATGYGVSARQA